MFMMQSSLWIKGKKTAPLSEEERRSIFVDKRRIIENLVERVELGKDRQLKVKIQLNILETIKQ
jgi:hypothetical protein